MAYMMSIDDLVIMLTQNLFFNVESQINGGNILDFPIVPKNNFIMSLYIHLNNLIFNLKIKLIMSRQIIALVILIISDNHVSHIIFVTFVSKTTGLFGLHLILSIV
jgi:hypothetical protein